MSIKIRNVYKYISHHLKSSFYKKHKRKHWIPIIANYDAGDRKLIVIITTYKSALETNCKTLNGENSYVVISPSDYGELSEKSFTDCIIYTELNNLFKTKDKKSDISEELLKQIKDAASENQRNPDYLKMELI